MKSRTNSFQTFVGNHSEVLCLSKPWKIKNEKLGKSMNYTLTNMDTFLME